MKDERKTKKELRLECSRLALNLIRNLRYNQDDILKKDFIALKQQLSKIPILEQEPQTYYIDLSQDNGGNGTIENPFGYLELTNKKLRGKINIKGNRKILLDKDCKVCDGEKRISDRHHGGTKICPACKGSGKQSTMKFPK